MIRSFISSIFQRRHFWRHATFGEIAELYYSRFLRIFALNLVSMFMSVYLFKLGYSILFIMVYLTCYFALKVPLAVMAALYTARFGPKHAILAANIAYIPALICFSFIPHPGASHAFIVLVGFGIFQAIGAVFYDYAYQVDFSKVKHSEHAGKELGFMHIVEKTGSILAPLAGGFIASLFGPIPAIIAAAILFAVAALPLLRSAEPTRTHQKIRLRGFPWRTTWSSMVAQTGIGVDNVTSSTLWSLFLATVIFSTQGEAIYLLLGALSALGMCVAFVSAFVFGRLIDRKRGHLLLRYGVLFNSLAHLLRPLVNSPVAAAGVSITSQVSTTAYIMAYTRGIFDVADYSGFRLTYLLGNEIMINIGSALLLGIMAVLLMLVGEPYAFTIAFVCAAAYTLIIGMPRFAIYRR